MVYLHGSVKRNKQYKINNDHIALSLFTKVKLADLKRHFKGNCYTYFRSGSQECTVAEQMRRQLHMAGPRFINIIQASGLITLTILY